MRTRSLLGIALLAVGAAHAQSALLRYTPPPNAFKSSIGGESYALNGTNASIQVYPFRSFSGNIQQQFQANLLRDWIDIMHKEENVAGKPTFQKVAVPGADYAISANFNEARVGLARPHNRMLIVKGNEAAIVDASAGTVQGWQQAAPRLNQMASSLRVETSKPPTPLTAEAGNAVAGLYMGTKQKYMASMINVTGSGYYTPALHYYLFSPDGRVYRAYDELKTPGGRFDFDAAERRDPVNIGRYTVSGGKLIIDINRNAPERIVTDAPRDGKVTIQTVGYEKQPLQK
jgi:hypothetical protein